MLYPVLWLLRRWTYKSTVLVVAVTWTQSTSTGTRRPLVLYCADDEAQAWIPCASTRDPRGTVPGTSSTCYLVSGERTGVISDACWLLASSLCLYIHVELKPISYYQVVALQCTRTQHEAATNFPCIISRQKIHPNHHGIAHEESRPRGMKTSFPSSLSHYAWKWIFIANENDGAHIILHSMKWRVCPSSRCDPSV